MKNKLRKKRRGKKKKTCIKLGRLHSFFWPRSRTRQDKPSCGKLVSWLVAESSQSQWLAWVRSTRTVPWQQSGLKAAAPVHSGRKEVTWSQREWNTILCIYCRSCLLIPVPCLHQHILSFYSIRQQTTMTYVSIIHQCSLLMEYFTWTHSGLFVLQTWFIKLCGLLKRGVHSWMIRLWNKRNKAFSISMYTARPKEKKVAVWI